MMQEDESRHQSQQVQEANLFQVDVPFFVSYSRTSISGVPLLSYRDVQREVSFSGEEIDRQVTALGELVTVTIDRVVDAFDVRFTLVVPTVRVTGGEAVGFETVAVETTDRFGAFVRPPGPVGAVQTYRMHQVYGEAQFIVS